MTKSRRSSISRHPLLGYFLLAFGLSWLVEVPLALQAQGLINTGLPFSLHYLSAFGPLLAAFYMTWRSGGGVGLRSLIASLIKWRVGMGWWAVALFPLFALLLLNLVLSLINGDPLSAQELGRVDYLPNLGVGAAFLWIGTFGLGEEAGWRGFALPRLQQGRSALSATLILWALWACWHLPLFFYMYPASILPGWLLGILAGTITFTWLFNSSGGSVLLTALFHGLFDYTTACYACKTGLAGAVISTLVMIWAVLAVVIFKPATLSSQGVKITSRLGNE